MLTFLRTSEFDVIITKTKMLTFKRNIMKIAKLDSDSYLDYIFAVFLEKEHVEQQFRSRCTEMFVFNHEPEREMSYKSGKGVKKSIRNSSTQVIFLPELLNLWRRTFFNDSLSDRVRFRRLQLICLPKKDILLGSQTQLTRLVSVTSAS